MSIDTYERVGENMYDKNGERLGRYDPEQAEPENLYVLHPIVNAEGEEVELIQAVGVDWKETPIDVMSQVNDALEKMGVEVRFIHIDCGDDAYWFGVEDV